MRTRKARPLAIDLAPSCELSAGWLLFHEWSEAARAWMRCPSDPMEARCRVARAAYYRARLGYVPPVRMHQE